MKSFIIILSFFFVATARAESDAGRFDRADGGQQASSPGLAGTAVAIPGCEAVVAVGSQLMLSPDPAMRQLGAQLLASARLEGCI